MELTYYSDVKEGKLQNNVRQKIAQELPHFNGKRVEIIIRKLTKKRSQQQNKLWWVYVDIIRKELGYDKDEMHEILKMQVNPLEKVNEKTGLVMTYGGSTKDLKVSEFMELIERLVRWSAENLDIVLPMPNEMQEINFGN